MYQLLKENILVKVQNLCKQMTTGYPQRNVFHHAQNEIYKKTQLLHHSFKLSKDSCSIIYIIS